MQTGRQKGEGERVRVVRVRDVIEILCEDGELVECVGIRTNINHVFYIVF